MIIPAILESSSDLIQEKIDLIAPKVEVIQIDVLDKNYAEGKTLNNIYSLSDIHFGKTLESHLMSMLIVPYIDVLTRNFNNICVHIEAEDLNKEQIIYLRQRDKRVGISLNADTDISRLEPYLDIVNYIQFMTTSTPGKQGGDLPDSILAKISKFKRIYPEIRVQADGGINQDNIQKVLQSGVDDVVIGSAIFGSEDPAASLENLQTAYGYN